MELYGPSNPKDFFGQFSDWTANVSTLLGDERLDLFGIPDPALHLLPLNCRATKTTVEWLTGTADTVQRGMWIIFWAAAYRNRRERHRTRQFRAFFFSWTDYIAAFETRTARARSKRRVQLNHWADGVLWRRN
jgi:hypothetical protein